MKPNNIINLRDVLPVDVTLELDEETLRTLHEIADREDVTIDFVVEKLILTQEAKLKVADRLISCLRRWRNKTTDSMTEDALDHWTEHLRAATELRRRRC